jgi:hypothetical protein
MATGTKERRVTIGDQVDFVREEVERAARLTEAARELARRMAAGHTPSSDERKLFKLIAWDQNDIDREVGRRGAVARWQAKAGTTESRAAASKELEDSKTAEQSDGPKLDEQIAELQRQRDAMRARVTNAESRLATTEQAVKVLRDLSSNHQEVSIQRRATDERYRELPALESEFRMIPTLRGLDEVGRLLHAQAVRREGVNLIDIHNSGGRNVESMNEVHWADYVQRREDEAVVMEQRLREMLAARAAEMALLPAILACQSAHRVFMFRVARQIPGTSPDRFCGAVPEWRPEHRPRVRQARRREVLSTLCSELRWAQRAILLARSSGCGTGQPTLDLTASGQCLLQQPRPPLRCEWVLRHRICRPRRSTCNRCS